MRRKVVQQGAATLMVSLPANWVKANGIEKGTEIDIEDKGSSLTISSVKESPAKKIEVDVDGLGPFMLRMLEALYKDGYDEIKVTYKDPKTINDVQKAIGKEISGLEIVEQGKNYAILQDIEGVIKERYDPAIRRTFFLLLQMAEESLPIIEQKRYGDLEPLRFTEEANNRFTTFCARTLSKKGHDKMDRIHFLYFLVESLEQLADQYKYLFDYLMQTENKKLPIRKEILKEYERLNKLIRKYYEFYYGFDKVKALEMYNLRKEIVSNCTELFKKSSGAECMVLHYLLVICQITFEMVEVTISYQF